MVFRLLAVLSVAAAYNPALLALDPDKSLYQFNCENWTRLNGLPAEGINSVVQSRDGYIWMASKIGLIRFDGVEFKAFQDKTKGVDGQSINDIAVAADGRILYSRSAGGYGSFDGAVFESLSSTGIAGDGSSSNAILVAKDGALWTGSAAGPERFAAGSLAGAVSQQKAYPTSSLSEDSEGRVWIGSSDHGLSYWANGHLNVVPAPDLIGLRVFSVASDPDGDIWVATSSGLRRYDHQFRRKEVFLAESRVTSLLVDAHGVVWAGTDGKGLARYQGGKLMMLGTGDGFGSDSVTAVFEDAEGSMWFGTTAGLSRLSDVKFPIYAAKEGFLPSSALTVCASAKGGLWAGTATGAAYFNPLGSANNHFSECLTNNYLVRAFEARNGDVYFADHVRNIFIVSGNDPVSMVACDSLPQSFAEDSASVLVGIGAQLFRIIERRLQPFVFVGNVPQFGWIFSLHVSRNGTIWVGTNHGLTRIDKGACHEWSTHDGLISNHVGSVTEDAEGAIWASTIWGIIRVRDGKLTMISRADGLSDDRIYGVVPDDLGYLWLNSAIGLQRISRQSVEEFAAGAIKRIDCQTYDGKSSVKFVDRDDQAFVGCKTADGRIWFPSPHGVILVDPASYFRNSVAPRVSIEKVSVSDREFTNRSPAGIRVGGKSARFMFTALGYIDPKKIRVRYKLEHFDGDWIEAGDNRSVAYEHLPPGPYVFHVQAANEDGVWSTDGVTCNIELLPPFYGRPWFYCLVGALASVGTFRLYWWKDRKRRARQGELLNLNNRLESMVKQRTNQLDRSLSMLTATLESTPDGVLAIQNSNDAASWNRQLVEIWDLPSEVTERNSGAPILAHMARKVREEEMFAGRISACFATPDAGTLDVFELKDNRTLEVVSRPQYLDGRCSGIVFHFRDVTERRQIEVALKASEQRFKAIFEQAAVGVAQIDLETGRFVHMNQYFCEMMGRSRRELQQLTVAEVTYPQEVALHAERMKMIRSGALRDSTQEGRYILKDGSSIWLNMTVSAMWRPGEEPDYVIAVAQDISTRKRLEDQLRQSQKMEAIGTLAGGIAHDFNNILSIIRGYTELAEMDIERAAVARGHLGAVRTATSRATDLVRQILTFSRQSTHELRPIVLASVVKETLGLLRATIPSNIEFKQTYAADVPTILADSTQVHQIVMNLGTNAWQAMKDWSGTLEIVVERCAVDAQLAAAQPLLKPGVYARITISDTGCGMNSATLGRIFEPFFTTKAPGEGTGLGLAVVHGIMAGHDGAITVHSTPGKGTMFRLYFPEHKGAVVEDSVREDVAPRAHGERILLVDDEELLAKMSRLALKSLGYEVETAIRPEVALEMFKADPEKFALVVTDYTMPGMNGLVLAERLREIRPGLPIILMTGNNLSLTHEKLLRAGIAEMLLKPSTLTALGKAVQRALSFAVANA